MRTSIPPPDQEDAAKQEDEQLVRICGVRRLECVEGGSSKFWEIERDGAVVTVHFGRIGTTGQTQVKDLGSEADAIGHVAKLVAEKLKKGYAVELLLKVQLGGGTDISRALAYGAQLVTEPRRAIVVLITDLFEGGDDWQLVRTARGLAEQGSHVLVLAALDEQAHPVFDRELGQRLAGVGAHVGAMTPGRLAAFIAEKVGR